MDLKAFFKLSYGLYIISSVSGDLDCGCIANTLQQVTAEPPMLSIALHKDNRTTRAILESGKFCGAVLTEEADMNLIGAFGFQTSEKFDKFGGFSSERDENGVRYVTDCVAARYSCEVVDSVDLGTHIMFIGKVTAAETLCSDPVMTYDYYHRVVKGKTPAKAPSYKGEDVKADEPTPAKASAEKWQCAICGYIYEGELPEGYQCPICGVPASKFEKIG